MPKRLGAGTSSKLSSRFRRPPAPDPSLFESSPFSTMFDHVRATTNWLASVDSGGRRGGDKGGRSSKTTPLFRRAPITLSGATVRLAHTQHHPSQHHPTSEQASKRSRPTRRGGHGRRRHRRSGALGSPSVTRFFPPAEVGITEFTVRPRDFVPSALASFNGVMFEVMASEDIELAAIYCICGRYRGPGVGAEVYFRRVGMAGCERDRAAWTLLQQTANVDWAPPSPSGVIGATPSTPPSVRADRLWTCCQQGYRSHGGRHAGVHGP